MSIYKKKQKQLSLFDESSLEESSVPQDLYKMTHDQNILWSKRLVRKSFPTELIIDFNQFMSCLENHSIQLTKKMGYISRKHLPSINERLSIKAESATNYSQQQYYPYIHFLYHIALAGNIIKKERIISTQLQLKVTDRWNLYDKLTDTEKYFVLLEIFWVDMNWNLVLNKRNHPIELVIGDVFTKLINKKYKRHLQFKDKESLLARFTSDWNDYFLYLEWFGLWVCEKDQLAMDNARRKTNYFVESITTTSFGDKMLPIILNDRHPQVWNIPFRRENGEVNPIPGSTIELIENLLDEQTYHKDDQRSHPFYKAFSSLFPQDELQQTLPRSKRRFTPGRHTFKITLGNSNWRRVILGAEHTMADLHHIIIDSFQFDDDHLYSFFMDGKKWSRSCIVAPFDDSGDPIATEIKIGAVGLYTGQQFMYLYDYGNEWTFTVTVEQIQENDPKPIKPYLIDQNGENPEQYEY